MFGRKKTAESPIGERFGEHRRKGMLDETTAPAATTSEAANNFGTNMAKVLENGPSSADLVDAVDRLKGAEDRQPIKLAASDKPKWDTHAASVEGVAEAVAEARREPDPEPEQKSDQAESAPEPGPAASHTIIERFAGHFHMNLDNLRTAEQNLVERMARNLEAYEAQRDHDAEELRQMRVAIEANDAAAKVLGRPAHPEPTGEQPQGTAKAIITRANHTASDAAANGGPRRRSKPQADKAAS